MRIITITCNGCGTIVAANELERRRIMRCPGLQCDEVLRFDEIEERERRFFLDHRNDYQLE